MTAQKHPKYREQLFVLSLIMRLGAGAGTTERYDQIHFALWIEQGWIRIRDLCGKSKLAHIDVNPLAPYPTGQL